jgi:two-component system response regulator YesN
MWKAILVDDEEFVRAELTALFPWEPYQFELVGEAENGETAMELVSITNPDLVITDIRMSPVDGLKLTSWLAEHYPDTVVAIVSAYNDFPLVREALRLGAVDYLIKAEATVDTVGAFLKRMDGILGQRNLARNRQRELTNNAAQYQILVIESLWRDILTRASDDAELKGKAEQLGIDLQHKEYALLFVHVVGYCKGFKQEQISTRKTLERMVKPNLEQDWAWNIIDLTHGDFVIVMSRRGMNSITETISSLQKLAHLLAENALKNWITSVSPKLCSFAELPGTYREVREINMLRIFNSGSRYFDIGDLSTLRQKKFPKIPELLSTWERILEGSEIKAIHDFLEHTFDKIVPVCFCPSEARWLAVDFINILRRVAFEYQVGWEEMKELADDFPNFLEQAESIKEWQERIESLAVQYIQCAKTHLNPQVSLIIRKALVYIQANFTRDLSLEEVAEYCGVSKSYLCRVFPDYTGEHFSDYLQQLRIDRAKQLLMFTNEHIYEIATKVGFWNSRYFSKVFHDVVGMTPADYRRIPLNETTVEQQLK